MSQFESEEKDCTSSVSAFLRKTYDMLMKGDYNDIICWSNSGDKFKIVNQENLVKIVLPIYFKHNNLQSFIRQLNIHGFKKDRKSKKKGDENSYYSHEFFVKSKPDLMSFIIRQSIKSKTDASKNKQIMCLKEQNYRLNKKIEELENSHWIKRVLTENPEVSKDLESIITGFSAYYKSQSKNIGVSEEEVLITKKTKHFLDTLKVIDDSCDEEDGAVKEEERSEDTISLSKRSSSHEATNSASGDYNEFENYFQSAEQEDELLVDPGWMKYSFECFQHSSFTFEY